MVVLKMFQQVRHLNAFSAAVTRPHRILYERTYQTVIVNSDGSSYNIRYHEPRQIIKMPINVWTLSEAERKARLEKRKPKQKVKIIDDIDDEYDSKKYLKYLKKK
ncbi:PREDICTED: 39S ribosomal protein L55, mitochondrial [Nicrophorus vespilloides]|uniref:39S ribosomal protein L55, mitochondrial n=1 Tax=Nicrophorus vespilloides TaxID=110193 RepID=A0ABM1ML36_NICVS|nr:PREDICTED: 39S ribosomal protein L55, mitochondrial [Nicrophorus vespilloides]